MHLAPKFQRALVQISVLGLALPFIGLASTPAMATEAEAVPTVCEQSSQDLVSTASVQEAVATTPEAEVSFICVDELVTVEVSDGIGESEALIVEKTTTDEVVDLTGLTEEQQVEVAPVVELGASSIDIPPADKTNSPDTFTINHSSRASSSDMVYWGTRTQAGVLIWSASAKITSYISLQKSSHPFNVTYTSLNNRQIDMTVPVRMKQHIRHYPDSVIDTNYYSPSVYGTTYSHTSSLLTTNHAGKFYPELFGMSLQDRSAGRSFKIGGTISYPRFQCYETTYCKYPNGQEASY